MAIAAALLCVSIVCYWSVRQYGFINWDDETYVLEQPQMREGLTWINVQWAFTTFAVANWHPLTWLSYLLDAEMFGLDNPGGFHITNVFIHAINSALLFAVLRSMTGSRWRSALVAALFALHPLHVESVAWVSERKDVLSTMFGLLALWAYARYARQPGLGRYLMVAALFALSLMAKPMLVTLPLVMLLLDYWPLKSIWISDLNPKSKIQNPKSFRFLLGEKLPLLVLSAASSVVTVFAQQHSGAVQPLSNLSFGRRLANAIDSYFMYLVDMLWPLNLVAQHPHPGLIPIWRTSIAAAILLAITAMCVWQIRRRPYLIVGWLWYLGTLVPVIGLVQVGGHARADRYTYVPLIGVFIMVCWLIPSAGASVRKSRATMTAMAGTALIVLGSLTFLTVPQCAVWKDSMTFWTAIIERGVQSTFAYNNRGSIHTRAGRLNDAEADYRKAIEISPTHAEAIYNLGSVLNEQGRPDEALIAYAEAVRIKSDFADAHYNAGNIHKARRAFEAAVACYSAAIAARPSYAEARTNMAGALHFLNRLDEAEVQYREALRLNPRIILAYDGLARVLLFKGKHAEAIELLRAGFKVDPSYAPIRELLTQYDTQPPPPPGP